MSRPRAFRRSRAFVSALLLAACCFASARAFADDETGYARHYAEGHWLVRAGHRRGAIRAFEAAYAASPKSDALFNIGVLYSKLAFAGGTVEDAHRSLDYFEQYLRRYAAAHGAAAPDRETVERYTARLRRRFGLVDEPSEIASPSAPAPEPSSPASPAIATDASSSPASPAIASPAPPEPPLAAPVALPAPAPPVHPSLAPAPHDTEARVAPSRARRVAGYALLATGLAAVGTSAVLFGVGYSSEGDKSGNLADYTDSLITLGHERTAGAVLSIAGAAVLVGAALTLLASPRHTTSHRTATTAARALIADGSF